MNLAQVKGQKNSREYLVRDHFVLKFFAEEMSYEKDVTFIRGSYYFGFYFIYRVITNSMHSLTPCISDLITIETIINNAVV